MIDPAALRKASQKQQRERHARLAERDRRLADIYSRYPPLRRSEILIRQCFLEAMSALAENRSEAVLEAQEKSGQLALERDAFLSEHGIDPSVMSEEPACDKCGDTGYIESRMCSCLKKLYVEQLLEDMSLPYPEADFRRFDISLFSPDSDPVHGFSPRENMEAIYDLCSDYARNFSASSENLFFNGGTGTGKTYLSCCIAKVAAQKAFLVIYRSAIECFQAYEHEKFDRAEPGFIRKIKSADLLVLDDLGTEFSSAFVQSAFYDIVSSRRGKATIINSNLTMEDLYKRYLPQSVSRLMGEYQMRFLFGNDLRYVLARIWQKDKT